MFTLLLILYIITSIVVWLVVLPNDTWRNYYCNWNKLLKLLKCYFFLKPNNANSSNHKISSTKRIAMKKLHSFQYGQIRKLSRGFKNVSVVLDLKRVFIKLFIIEFLLTNGMNCNGILHRASNKVINAHQVRSFTKRPPKREFRYKYSL